MSYSDDFTEDELTNLEKRLGKIYKEAYEDLQTKANNYFSQYEDRWQKEYEAYQNGKYTKLQFQAWEQSQLMRGKHWEELRTEMAERMVESNKIANAYVRDAAREVYIENYNYSCYEIEDSGAGISFTLIDEETVKRLSSGPVRLLPKPRLAISDNEKWNEQKIQNAILQGILQGESIDQIADRLMNVANMNRNAAIATARTAITSAQNGGRQASFDEAEKMGIELDKEWMSTDDGRTRESHREMNGVVVKSKDTFPNGLMYPGDPAGDPEEVMRCRCTMTSFMPKYDSKRTSNTKQSYEKWKAEKQKEKKYWWNDEE